VDEGSPQPSEGHRPVMGVRAAAELLGVSEDWVRRWIDANEPDADHPERVPVARVRGLPGKLGRRWRRPYRDAVEAEARRQRGEHGPGGAEGAPAPPP
jgi:hypothetical protein